MIADNLKKFPMDGIEIWKNGKNQFMVFQLHYLANPLKRSAEWKKSVKSSLTNKRWMQEYEISWESQAGKPVYNDFSKKIHGAIGLQPEPGLPLLRGWDFGLTPACVIGQLQGRQLVIFKELISHNMGIKRFCSEIVTPYVRNQYPGWSDAKKDWIDFIDPAGLQRMQTDETTCAQHMAEAGIRNIFPGAIDWETRRSSVENFLIKFMRRGTEVMPCFQIDLAGCPTVVQGFTGGYQYPEKTLEIEPDKIRPLKNKFSHPHDGLQYLCSMVSSLVRPGFGETVDIPAPSYDYGQVSR